MKINLKIIQYLDGTYGAKKKGLFGWKYLNEIYDGYFCWHYSWCYSIPDGIGIYDKFKTRKECVNYLRQYYHENRELNGKKLS